MKNTKTSKAKITVIDQKFQNNGVIFDFVDMGFTQVNSKDKYYQEVISAISGSIRSSWYHRSFNKTIDVPHQEFRNGGIGSISSTTREQIVGRSLQKELSYDVQDALGKSVGQMIAIEIIEYSGEFPNEKYKDTTLWVHKERLSDSKQHLDNYIAPPPPKDKDYLTKPYRIFVPDGTLDVHGGANGKHVSMNQEERDEHLNKVNKAQSRQNKINELSDEAFDALISSAKS